MADLTYETAIQAMEKAYDAGRMDDAREMAALADQLKPKGVTHHMGFLNRGIANTLGGAVDLVNPFDNPAWGEIAGGKFQTGSAREGLMSGMKAIGAEVSDREPETVMEHIMQGGGEAAGALPILLPALSQAAQAGGKIGTIAADAYQAITGRGFASAGAGMATEVASGAAAEGAAEATKRAGGGDLAQVTAGVLAGGAVLPAVMGVARAGGVMGSAVSAAMRRIRPAIAPFTQGGGRDIALQRVQGLVGDERAMEVGASIKGETELGLTPAQQTQDPGLLALERGVAKKDPIFAARLKAREEGGRERAEEIIRGLTEGGDPAKTREFYQAQRSDFAAAMNAEVDNALMRASVARDGVTPVSSEMDNSLRVVEELQDAMKAARANERELWSLVPDDVLVSTENATNVAREIQSTLGAARVDDMPKEVADLLLGNNGLGQVTNMLEMRSLYSRLRELERVYSAGDAARPNFARIAGRVADAILVDYENINAGDNVAQIIATARAASAELNRTFRTGAVGRILQKTRGGAPRMEPETALEKTVGQRGASGDVSARQIEGAATSASPEIQDFLRSRFSESLMRPDGETVSISRAQSWLRDNAEIVARYPQLKTEFEEAVRSTEAATSYSQKAQKWLAALNDPRRSATYQFIQRNPDEAITSALKSKDPVKQMGLLANAASKDTSGEAMDGLRAAVVDNIVSKSASMSGVDLMSYVNKNNDALKRVLTPEQMGRIRVIARELVAQQGAAKGDAVAEISTQKPSKAISMMLRIQAASIGGQMAKARGAGGAIQIPGMFSARTQEVLEQITSDKAQAILMDAVDSPELMRDLLLDLRSVPNQKKFVARVSPYVFGAGSSQLTEAGDND